MTRNQAAHRERPRWRRLRLQRRGGIPGTMKVISFAGPGLKHDIQRALNVRNLEPRPR